MAAVNTQAMTHGMTGRNAAQAEHPSPSHTEITHSVPTATQGKVQFQRNVPIPPGICGGKKDTFAVSQS